VTRQQDSSDNPTFRLSPVKSNDLKSDPDPFDFTQSLEQWQYQRSLAGSPFDSSDSDSSDCDDDTLSVASLDLFPTARETPFSKDGSLVNWEGDKTMEIMEGNALGLVFSYEEDVIEAKAVATFTQQAESLRAPRSHQDDRSCDRPDQKHPAQQERLAFQTDSPADETLARRFPQDIDLRGDVSDSLSPMMFQGLNMSPSEEVGSRGLYYKALKEDWPEEESMLLRAPRMRTISLPEEDEEGDGQDLFYGGSDLGGWLTGASDGVPKTAFLDCLDEVPFAMVD